ncbi:DMT family transporter [Halomonas denitrificans]|nr:DMT family transporter [Halomonas denitrificans]
MISPVLLILAALFWGLAGGLGGLLLERGWDPFLVALVRGAVGWLFVLAWLALRPGGHGFGRRWLWIWSGLAGLGVAGNFAFYFTSVQHGSVAVAATLMYCAPVFVFLVSFAFRLERPSGAKWTAIGFVLLGVFLVTGAGDLNATSIGPVAVATGLLAGLSYAGFIFGFKFASRHGSPQAVLAVAFAVVVVGLLALSGIDRFDAVLVETPDRWLFLALGVLGAGVSFVLYVIGLRQTPPAIASMIAMVEPVAAALFGVLVLSETLAASQLVGMAIVLATVTVLSLLSRDHRRPSLAFRLGRRLKLSGRRIVKPMQRGRR